MSKSVADVMQLVKDEDVKFVDFRFTDTRGKEQHVSVPVSAFDEDKFESGHAFDGSSSAGLRRRRTGGRQGLRARSALAREARRSVPEEHGSGRHGLLRSGTRILHFRLGPV